MPYKSKPRKSIFPHIVVLFVLLLLLIGMAVLGLLWNALEEYESSTPQTAMKSVVAALEADDLQELARLCGVDTTRFFDETQYAAYVRQELGADRSGLQVVAGSTDEPGAAAYRVLAGERSMTFLLYPREEGGYTIRMPEAPVSSYRIYAPEYAQVMVNGRPLTAAEQTGEKRPVASFQTLDDSLVPYHVEYTVDGFIEKPEVTLAGMSEAEYRLEETEDSFTFTTYPTEAEQAEYAALAEQLARTYALYVSKDLEFTDLKPLLYPESSFYETVRTIDRSWYIAHEPPEFLEMQVANIVAGSEDHFTAEVSFVFKVVSDKRTTQMIPNNYRLAFLRTEEGFRLANLEFI